MIASKITYRVIPSDILQKSGTVYRLDEGFITAIMYNVNISEKTCSCFHYQQSGVPCIHAIVLLKHFNLPIKTEYFYDFCYLSRLQHMFNSACSIDNGKRVNKFALVLPTESKIYELLNTGDDKYHIIPKLSLIKGHVVKSSKRIRSLGETGSRGVKNISGRKTCQSCTKSISTKTKHKISACIKHFRRVYGKLPELNQIDNTIQLFQPPIFLKSPQGEKWDPKEIDTIVEIKNTAKNN